MSAQLEAQDITYSNTNTWFLWLNNLKLNESFSLGTEIHDRFGAPFQKHAQFIFRPWLEYHYSDVVHWSAGYSFVKGWPYSPGGPSIASSENNIWEQLLLTSITGKTVIQNRIRLEHRWNQVLPDTGPLPNMSYSNRFRFRWTIRREIFTLNHSSQIFLMLFDEIWMNQNSMLIPIALNRNWLYLGVGYSYLKKVDFILAYQHQMDLLANNNFVYNPILQLTIASNFSLK